MNGRAPSIDLEELIAGLRATDDPDARARLLDRERDPSSIRRIAERLKDEADSDSYLGTFSWSSDIVALGTRAGMPTVVALGRMAEALTLFYQDQIPEALTVFDEASGIFRVHGDEVGWARTQIGRTAPCAMLGRFDEALERAQEARAILEAAGEHAYIVRIDMNLSLLLERMNRPREALDYSERALAAYRGAAPSHYAMHALQNHALLLWRIGRVREAIESYQEARAGYLALGSATDAARQDLHLGAAYLALGRYAEAVTALMAARRALGAADAGYLAACAGMSLAECFVRLGRFHEAINVATAAGETFTQCKTTLEGVQTLIWKALAYSGLHDQETALGTLESAADLPASDDSLASYQATLDVSRAQLLLETGRAADAGMLLARAIPALRQAGLSVETATAQAFWGETLIEDHRFTEAASVAGEVLAVADREGLDWLAARALHLRAQAALRRGDDTGSWKALTAATRRLDHVHRHIAWDDRVTSAGASIRIYRDAMALALRRGDPVMALHYAERSKARALADHLRAGIDVRPRVRDQRSAVLIAELEELRERYAWLGSAHSAPSEATAPLAALRWATAPPREESKRVEMARIEQRRAEIWRELQVSNPAYRGEAALSLLDEAGGDLDESAAQVW
ncbi:MAG: tetratricopeptide repeat protein, partial [Chloroflexota bacterium]